MLDGLAIALLLQKVEHKVMFWLDFLLDEQLLDLLLG